MRVMKTLERMGKELLNLLYPRRAVCMGCGSMLGCERDDLCEDCRVRLAKGWVGLHPVSAKLGLDGAAFAYGYHGVAGGLVRRLKYSGVTILAEGMAKDLSRAVADLRIDGDVLLTAVPMPPRRRRLRGFNHAEVLARALGKYMALDYAELLMRTRNAPQQARLSREERLKNLKGGFVLRPEWTQRIQGAKVLLVDDVFTTGATAAACADALKCAGADRVYFAAYAYGERKKHG